MPQRALRLLGHIDLALLEALNKVFRRQVYELDGIRAIENGTLDREDNPLKNAPHTATCVMAENWTRGYSRELAAFPLAVLKTSKYWPPVARVDNVYGDRNIMCACIPIESFKEAEVAG